MTADLITLTTPRGSVVVIPGSSVVGRPPRAAEAAQVEGTTRSEVCRGALVALVERAGKS